MGSTAVIEALLRAGADPNLRDPVLGLTVMHDAAREGFADSVRVLLAYGADPNLVDDTGNLPLHLAATEGHLEATRQLIAATADPRAPNGLGHSAGQEARIHKRVETAQYIEDYLGTGEWSVGYFKNSVVCTDLSHRFKDVPNELHV